MTQTKNALAILLFSELLAADHAVRGSLTKILPKGMEISHFSVLNVLAFKGEESTPAKLAERFNVTRGAMTNTLNKLQWAGYIHVRPDWDDARRKIVQISPAGRQARDDAFAAITPIITRVVDDLGEDQARAALPILRGIRKQLA
ncbi:MAG: DNA-binding MarR family transcriptional regulator [Sulfitobacter sp.]|jgi:DNA-binding MarR family transcriptional regulator